MKSKQILWKHRVQILLWIFSFLLNSFSSSMAMTHGEIGQAGATSRPNNSDIESALHSMEIKELAKSCAEKLTLSHGKGEKDEVIEEKKNHLATLLSSMMNQDHEFLNKNKWTWQGLKELLEKDQIKGVDFKEFLREGEDEGLVQLGEKRDHLQDSLGKIDLDPEHFVVPEPGYYNGIFRPKYKLFDEPLIAIFSVAYIALAIFWSIYGPTVTDHCRVEACKSGYKIKSDEGGDTHLCRNREREDDYYETSEYSPCLKSYLVPAAAATGSFAAIYPFILYTLANPEVIKHLGKKMANIPKSLGHLVNQSSASRRLKKGKEKKAKIIHQIDKIDEQMKNKLGEIFKILPDHIKILIIETLLRKIQVTGVEKNKNNKKKNEELGNRLIK